MNFLQGKSSFADPRKTPSFCFWIPHSWCIFCEATGAGGAERAAAKGQGASGEIEAAIFCLLTS